MAATEAGRAATDWSFRAEGVTKIYGKTLRANDAITLSMRPGEVYGLLGPNGAGSKEPLTSSRFAVISLVSREPYAA